MGPQARPAPACQPAHPRSADPFEDHGGRRGRYFADHVGIEQPLFRRGDRGVVAPVHDRGGASGTTASPTPRTSLQPDGVVDPVARVAGRRPARPRRPRRAGVDRVHVAGLAREHRPGQRLGSRCRGAQRSPGPPSSRAIAANRSAAAPESRRPRRRPGLLRARCQAGQRQRLAAQVQDQLAAAGARAPRATWRCSPRPPARCRRCGRGTGPCR